MTDDIELPDKLKILHGDRIDEISSDAKTFYEAEEDAELINGIRVQTFNYGIPKDNEHHPVIDATFAYDTTTETYYQFVHELGFSPDGLRANLSHKVTITATGERIENSPEELPEEVITAINTYLNQ